MNTNPSAELDCSSDILLVDDNKHGLVARKTLLQEKGYVIATATSPAEALDLIAKTRFALVVTDYKMPAMDGVELIRRLRASVPGVRTILLSGFVEPLGLNEQTTGADVVISKNASEVGNLLRSVDRLLSRRLPRKAPHSQRPSPRKIVTA